MNITCQSRLPGLPTLAIAFCVAFGSGISVVRGEDTAEIVGRFSWLGEVPARKTLERSERLSDQRWVFSSSPPLLRGWTVSRESRGIRDLYVYLTQNDGSPLVAERRLRFSDIAAFQEDFVAQNGFAIDTLAARMVGCEFPKDGVRTDASLVICHKGRFVPECIAVEDGQPVVFVNCDRIGYYLYLGRGAESETFALAPGAARVCLWSSSRRFDVTCNIHPWMKLSVMVFTHPYFAITDETGKFSLGRVPSGSYRLAVRHFDTFIAVRDSKAHCASQGAGLPIHILDGRSLDVGSIVVSCPDQ